MAKTGRSRKKKRGKVNPLAVVLITCASLLVVLVVGLLIAKSSVQGWLRGDEFRDWVVKKASAVLRSDIELAEVKWQGSEIYADQFRAHGYEEAAFSKLALDGVRAKADGIKDGAFLIPEVTVNRFEMEFSNKRNKPLPGEAAESPAVVKGPGVPDWLARYLPNRAEVGEINLSSARVDVKKADGSIPFHMSGVRAAVEPDFRTGIWEIKGRGGKIVVPNQPEIVLKDLGMRWRQRELFIDRCGLGIYGDGHVDGSGEISFAGDGNFDLELEISSIDVDKLVEGEWKERLSGTVEGPVRITGRPGAFVYEGTLSVADAAIKSIPVLRMVAEYTRNDQFKHLVLSEAKTDFKREGEVVHFTNLVLQSAGLVRVEGEMVMSGGAIDGRFRVGVTPGTLRWIPGAERQVFTEDKDGFLWTPMTLTGTVEEPKEDLSGRLVAAAGTEILKNLPEGLLNEAQKFLNPASANEAAGEKGDGSATDAIIETGKPLIDLLTPFLK